MRPARPPVPVRLPASGAGRDLVESVASALGAAVDVQTGPPGTSELRVGDRVLSADCARWQVEAALLRALEPRHVLFLCVANSARSQIGEGIARRLAGERVRVSSAGSEPSSVRPQAVAVLGEIGIDASGQRSKGTDEVERPVDAVVTLCAEELCPVWLEDAWRLHWGLPDPAAAEGTDEARLDAFRSVRDELARRLELLLGPVVSA